MQLELLAGKSSFFFFLGSRSFIFGARICLFAFLPFPGLSPAARIAFSCFPTFPLCSHLLCPSVQPPGRSSRPRPYPCSPMASSTPSLALLLRRHRQVFPNDCASTASRVCSVLSDSRAALLITALVALALFTGVDHLLLFPAGYLDIRDPHGFSVC